MTGSDAAKFFAIETSCGGVPVWQAPSSAEPMSSITAKSAASALSMTCTRTVAFAGLVVKLTWRLDCQGSAVSCTEVSATATQGRVSEKISPRARKAVTARGTTEARTRKRNMHTYSLNGPRSTRGAYGWWSVKKSGYRGVDADDFQAARRKSSANAR